MERSRSERDRFVTRIDRRMRWNHRCARLGRLLGATGGLQAAVYDATFRSDAEAVSYFYALTNDHLPDLDHPTWLNEKIRWQFLHHRNPLMSLAADKIAVREYLLHKQARVAAPAMIATGAVPVPRFDRARLASLVREGWPLMLSGFAVIIYMRIDQVMLGHLSTETELGLYGVAVRVADAALVVPVALRASFFASILRAHKAGPEAFERQSQRLYDVMFVAGVGTMLAVGLASYLLFEPVFGADYAMGLPMVLVLLLALPWVALGSGRGPILIAQGWLWTTTATTAMAALVNVGLNFALIPQYGGIGAAAATVVSYWLAGHGSSFLFAYLRPTGRAMTRSLNIFGAVSRILRALKAGDAE